VWSTASLLAAVAAAGDLTGAPLRAVLGGLATVRVRQVQGAGLPAWFDCDTHDDLRQAQSQEPV
jgi:hypothetical protein